MKQREILLILFVFSLFVSTFGNRVYNNNNDYNNDDGNNNNDASNVNVDPQQVNYLGPVEIYTIEDDGSTYDPDTVYLDGDGNYYAYVGDMFSVEGDRNLYWANEHNNNNNNNNNNNYNNNDDDNNNNYFSNNNNDNNDFSNTPSYFNNRADDNFNSNNNNFNNGGDDN